MTTLTSRSVTHSFGSTLVLQDVDLTIDDSEFVTLIGPSGCGKTTLLNLFAGFIHPQHGTCQDRNGLIRGPSSSRTVVFQEYALFPWLDVHANLAAGLEAKGLDRQKIDAAVSYWLSLVGLGHVASRYPSQLSGGMKQRVAIARALALDPEIILMDEPFGALDLLTREALQEEVLRIRGEASGSFMLITHSVDEAVFMSDRIAVMSHSPGRIVEMVTVDLPYPRTAALRVDPDFLKLRAYVTGLLRRESTASPSQAQSSPQHTHQAKQGGVA
ncbi:MAG: ABC transporter ATP-binding protein [Hyphomicrobiaceae bacterium]